MHSESTYRKCAAFTAVVRLILSRTVLGKMEGVRKYPFTAVHADELSVDTSFVISLSVVASSAMTALPLHRSTETLPVAPAVFRIQQFTA